jgi:hypothetical protein
MSDQQTIERQVAAMHRVIATRLRQGDRSPIVRARSNLERWRVGFGGTLPPAYAEWIRLLESGEERVFVALESGDQDAVRLRSSSPFTGVLTAQERWRIMRDAA